MPTRLKPWIGFVLVLLCITAWSRDLYANQSPEKFSRAFSMNLHCALGNWRARLNEIIDELIVSRPQVMAFQEVCQNKNVDMALYLVDQLTLKGLPVTYWKTVNTHGTFWKYQEQLLLISTLPVHGVEDGKLPSMIFFGNKYLGFQVDGLWAVTTHLHFWLPQIRKKQYQKLAKLWNGRPVMMMGDFNSEPTSSEARPFKKAGWTSLFDGPTFPAEKPKDIFDGFYFSEELGKRMLGANMRKYFEKASQEHTPPSDHLGIGIDFSLSD